MALRSCTVAALFVQFRAAGDRRMRLPGAFEPGPAMLLQEGCDECVAGGEGNGRTDQECGEAVHVLLPLVANFVLLKVTLAVTVAK